MSHAISRSLAMVFVLSTVTLSGAANAGAWQPIPGRAVAVAVGADDSVFILGWSATPGGHPVFQYNGSGGWVQLDGGGVSLAVGPNGDPWLVNSAGSIFHRV